MLLITMVRKIQTLHLILFSEVIRKTFFDGGVDEIIATRRLVHIINAYAIFNNKLKAVEVCINRFDDDTKKSFLDLYTKVDAGVSIEELNQGSFPMTMRNLSQKMMVSKFVFHNVDQ